MTDEVLSIFIGYDSREHDAYQVCKSSLMRHSTIPLHIQPLDERALRHAGFFNRKWITEKGQKFDKQDGKPFSTEFSFTRFLVPSLCQWKGWAIFVDCDFLFMADIAELAELFEEGFYQQYAVMCCQQQYVPKGDVKMDGQMQQKYWRKNWSSFMAFNNEHPANRMLTPYAVNHEYGGWLHSFSWLHDNEIGDLDHGWNWLSGTTKVPPKAVHYSEGGPWFPAYKDVEYAHEWLIEAQRLGITINKAAA